MFFNEILNKMASKLNNFSDQRIAMCEVINFKQNFTENNDVSYEVTVYNLMRENITKQLRHSKNYYFIYRLSRIVSQNLSWKRCNKESFWRRYMPLDSV